MAIVPPPSLKNILQAPALRCALIHNKLSMHTVRASRLLQLNVLRVSAFR